MRWRCRRRGDTHTDWVPALPADRLVTANRNWPPALCQRARIRLRPLNVGQISDPNRAVIATEAAGDTEQAFALLSDACVRCHRGPNLPMSGWRTLRERIC
jgi:hypothetical protein